MDKNSETWREISAWTDVRLKELSDRLEGIGVGAEETWTLRGQIKMLRALLALAEPDLRVVETSEDYGFQGIDDVSA